MAFDLVDKNFNYRLNFVGKVGFIFLLAKLISISYDLTNGY